MRNALIEVPIHANLLLYPYSPSTLYSLQGLLLQVTQQCTYTVTLL